MTTYPKPSDPVGAFTRADGTTEAHGTDHGRVIGIWENPKHHGAKANGSDDTAAIQAAHTAALAGPMAVYFPKGVYNHTALTWDARVRMLGPGTTMDEVDNVSAATGALLNYTPNTGTAVTITNAVTGSGPHMENIGFVGSSAANNTIGVYLDGPNSLRVSLARGMLHNVRASKFGTGIKTSATLETTFLNCYSVGNGQNLHLSNVSNACSIIGGAYRVATTNGIHLEDTSSTFISPGVVVETNGASGLLVDGVGNMSGMTIGGHYENNVRGIYLHGTAASLILDSTFSGALFSGNSGTDFDITYGRNLFSAGQYFVDAGSVTLDANTAYCTFFGMRAGVTITDGGTGNFFLYSDSNLQLQASTGSGVHVANGFLEMDEISAPAAAPANHGYLYMRDTGGKTQFVARFPSGAVQVIATEP